VIFYVLLTKKPLFKAKNLEELFKINELCKIDLEFKELPNITEPCKDLLRSMLEINPEKRFTASQCLQHKF
jgi:serine/threonine protein kinase